MAVMTVQERADDISAEFEFLDDWETRYAHIIDLGKQNPALEPEERTEDARVRGCASQVWMVFDASEGDRLKMRAESDAMIVSGLIALLIRLFSDARKDEILAFDAPAFLENIGVTGALTAQRSNGLNSMLERIKSAADAQPVSDGVPGNG
ncbi:SufE family protein [Henriciella sp.]|uniref:SufE family protein n=1 Tax=Henriciella sp. TaxID=1968823 RepID=UPI00260EA5D3|nr:SufE family protein [Henriciella sp.]